MDRCRAARRPRAVASTVRPGRIPPPFRPHHVAETLAAMFAARLSPIVTRTMILELNLMRTRGMLGGETPEARFSNYLEQLKTGETQHAIMAQYPVMARKVLQCIAQCLDATCEFFQRLDADWNMLRSVFGQNPGRLRRTQATASDPHKNGRCVMIAEFVGGWRLVYKRRSLAVDSHVQQLLAWVNAHTSGLSLRTLTVVDRGDYGWMEFVTPAGCQSRDQLGRFYRRQGALLAILHMLDATDFHAENLIAAGDQPVLIDLESMFHHHTGDTSDSPRLTASQLLSRSVTRIGLLPDETPDEASGVVDFSGMGGAAGQRSASAQPRVTGMATDEMRIMRERVEVGGGDHRPRLVRSRASIDITRHIDDVLAGFEEVYRTLVVRRVELLAPGGPLEAFKADRIRIIMRPTGIYLKLLSESRHPDLMRCGLCNDAFLDRLWLGVTRNPRLEAVIEAELRDLRRGDTPLFTSTPVSRQIFDSAGNAIDGVVTQTGMDATLRKIAGLCDADLRRQKWAIRASLSLLSTGREQYRKTQTVATSGGVAEPVAEARRAGGWIADHAAEIGVGREARATWLTLENNGDTRWQLDSDSRSLYHGHAGIALFLAYFGRTCDDRGILNLARQTANSVRRHAADTFAQIGVFDGGAGGALYACTHLGVLLDAPKLIDHAIDLSSRIGELAASDDVFDVVGGSAGCILALLGLHRVTGNASVLSAARACADHLVASASIQASGVGWLNAHAPNRPLAGFAHGAAGIAWSLALLGQTTGNPEYLTFAKRALEQENTLYSPQARNWENALGGARTPGANLTSNFPVAWCHGSAGIALGRALMLSFGCAWPSLAGDLDTALNTTLRGGFGSNDSLCHGDLGNLDIIAQAAVAAHWSNHAIASRIGVRKRALVASISRRTWRCATPGAAPTPGLMVGVAGIGLGLLRLAQPERIPSVLALDALPECWLTR